MTSIEAAQALWKPSTVYLNTASFGLPPTPVWDGLQDVLRSWRAGSTGWLPWSEKTQEAREAFARLVGVDDDLVAVGSNVSSFAGLVAASLPPGSTVLAPEIEFTSNLFPWMIHEDRGVKVRTVPQADVIDEIDDDITLVAVSAVQSASGEVTPLDELADAARRHGAQVFLDATQACGWLPLDASTFDFVACAAYKWLMAPRGSAFLTMKKEHVDSLKPVDAGWFAGDEVHDSYYGPPLRLADSARRFDISPAWFSWVGTALALDVLEGLDVQEINAHNIALANRFLEGAGAEPGNSAIVSVDVADGDARLSAAGILGAVRAGNVRLSFHLYNTAADVDAALDALYG